MKWAGLAAAALLVAAGVYVFVSREPRPALPPDITLAWLADHQNPDGSWGDVPAPLGGRTIGRAGITSLALLAFLDASYCHLSKDKLGERPAKDVVWAAIEWLRRDQRSDATFTSSLDLQLELALAAVAHGEAYDMTGSALMKVDAQRALDALAAKQAVDGSWGSPEATEVAALAFRLASYSELPFDRQVSSRLQAYYDARGASPADAGEMIARSTLTINPALAPAADALLAKGVDAYQPDYFGVKQATQAIILVDGFKSARLKRWSDSVIPILFRARAPDGLWHGSTLSETVVQCSLAESTLRMAAWGPSRATPPAPKKRFPWLR
jgi:hypothetical protein